MTRPAKTRPSLVPAFYVLFVAAPLYWLLVTSFKTQNEAISGLSFFPTNPTLDNYLYILTDPVRW